MCPGHVHQIMLAFPKVGVYPQPIREVLLWDNIMQQKPVNPFGTCCRHLKW